VSFESSWSTLDDADSGSTATGERGGMTSHHLAALEGSRPNGVLCKWCTNAGAKYLDQLPSRRRPIPIKRLQTLETETRSYQTLMQSIRHSDLLRTLPKLI
jgi:hypothetical protein